MPPHKLARHRDYVNMYEEKTYQTRIFVLKSADGNRLVGNSHDGSIAVELLKSNISSPGIKLRFCSHPKADKKGRSEAPFLSFSELIVSTT